VGFKTSFVPGCCCAGQGRRALLVALTPIASTLPCSHSPCLAEDKQLQELRHKAGAASTRTRSGWPQQAGVAG
jgi:hypothetical protein